MGIIGITGDGADELRRILHGTGYSMGRARVIGSGGITSVRILQIVMDMERYVFLYGEVTVQSDVAHGHLEGNRIVGNGGLIQGVPSGESVILHRILCRMEFHRHSLAVIIFFCLGNGGSTRGSGSLVSIGNGVLVPLMELVHSKLTVGTHFTGGYGIHRAGNAGYGSTRHGCIQCESFVHAGSGGYGSIGGTGAVHGFLNGIGTVQILYVVDGLIGDAGVGSKITDQFHITVRHRKAALICCDCGIGGLPSGKGISGIGEIGGDGHVGTEIHAGLAGRCGCARIVAGDFIGYVVLVGGKGAVKYDILLRHRIRSVGSHTHVGGGPAAKGIAGDQRNRTDHALLTACQAIIGSVRYRLIRYGIGILITNGVCLDVGRLYRGHLCTCGVQQIGRAVVGGDLTALHHGGVGIDHIVIGGCVDHNDQSGTVIVLAVLGAGGIGHVVFVVVEAVYLYRLALHSAAQTGVGNCLGPSPGAVRILHTVGFVQRYGLRTVGNSEESGHSIHDLRGLTQLDGGRFDVLCDCLEDHRQRLGAGGYQIVSGGGVSVRAGGIQIGRVGIVAGYVMEEFIQLGGGVVHIRLRSHADGIYLRRLLDALGNIDSRIGNVVIKAAGVIGLTVGEYQHNLIALCGARIVGSQNHLCQSQTVIDGGSAAGCQCVYRREQCLVTVAVCYRQVLHYFGIVVVVVVLVITFSKGRTAAVIAVIREFYNSDAMLKRFDLCIGQVLQLALCGNFRILLVGGFDKGIHRRLQRIDMSNIGSARVLPIELHHRIAELAGFAGIITQARIHVYGPVIRVVIPVIVVITAVRALPCEFHVMRAASVPILIL